LLPPRAKNEACARSVLVMLAWTGVRERVESETCCRWKRRKRGRLGVRDWVRRRLDRRAWMVWRVAGGWVSGCGLWGGGSYLFFRCGRGERLDGRF
jgi:hypothetical protein